ncbi:hypothetical protein [Parabacteroides sp.]
MRNPLFRYICLFSFCLLATFGMQAQFLDYGSDPARFKWNIVKLPHYNLVYPQGIDSMAYRYALYLENAYPHEQKTIGKPIQMKFPVILHPANMSSNGLVSWAPRRMELITTPSSKLEGLSWDKHLVLHESRHVFQMGKVMNGWFRPLYYIIGEQAAGVAAFFLPTWFLEGDAVAAETSLSNGGRGRLPEFSMPYRAQMLGDGKNFSFDKWSLGSYKDYTGDFYALGFNLTAYARHRFGADIWDKTTSRYVSHFFNIPMFSNAFRHYSGITVDRLYDDTFDFLRNEWTGLDTSVIAPDYLSPEKKLYTSYRYPQVVDDSTVIAVKSGLQDINSLVSITNGREKRLCNLGSINSRLNLSGKRLYWTEIVPGLRWTHENYSVLKQYDLETGKTSILTPRQRYLAPAIDKEGRMAAVSRFGVDGTNQLVLLDLATGQEKALFATPGNAFIKELTFDDNGMITTVAVTDTGISLFQLNTQTGAWNELLKTTSINITSPVWSGGKLFFESGANGTNNIYRLNPADGTTSRLTSARFGAFDPAFSPQNDKLFYADYQAGGYRVGSLPVDSLLEEKADLGEPYRSPLVTSLAEQEQFNLDSATLTPVEFNPRPYRKGLHTFKIHSWAPFYYDVAEAMNTGADDLSTIVKPGAMVLSQNTLNTAIMQAGWYYRKGEHHGKLAFTYSGWFPVIDIAADYGGKAFDVTWATNEEGKEIAQAATVRRTLLEAEARVYLPFNLTRNHYIRGIQPAFTYYFTTDKYQQYESRKFSNFQYILPEILFYNYRRKASRDILPRWGYQLRLQYLQSPFNKENYGSLYAGRLTTYWPGILRNHGLMLRLGYQYQSVDNKTLYLPKHLIETPRGYNFIYQTRQQIGFKADYAFSLFSPDWSLWQLAYIRRLRANLFYDLSRNQAAKGRDWMTQSSVGTDLIFDWNVFRMSYPLTTGIRLIQPIDYGKFQVEALFSISF